MWPWPSSAGAARPPGARVGRIAGPRPHPPPLLRGPPARRRRPGPTGSRSLQEGWRWERRRPSSFSRHSTHLPYAARPARDGASARGSRSRDVRQRADSRAAAAGPGVTRRAFLGTGNATGLQGRPGVALEALLTRTRCARVRGPGVAARGRPRRPKAGVATVGGSSRRKRPGSGRGRGSGNGGDPRERRRP